MKAKASPAFLDAMREIDILKQVSHKNIIRLYEVIDDPNDDKLYLVLEYAARGQIMDYDSKDRKFRIVAEGLGSGAPR